VCDDTTVSALAPEELHDLFVAAVNAGDLDGLTNLYEPECVGGDIDGGAIHGRDQMKAFLTGFLETVQSLESETRKVHSRGDVALLSSDWRAVLRMSDGHIVTSTGRSAEVARRQPDGSWLFAIDDPIFFD
jgi:uncharacterized protein (TIGR02246 family)